METRKSNSICKAIHPYTKKSICNRSIWDDNEKLCIFHNKKKPVDEFRSSFLAELNYTNETNKIKEFDCRCFVFPSKINLQNLSFNKPTDFRFATFGDETDFQSTKFSDNSNFESAVFGDKTFFMLAEFGNGTNFLFSIFGKETNFWLAKFGDKTHFPTKFGDKTLFSLTLFGNEASFLHTEFGESTSFTKAKFGNKTTYRGAKFGDETSFVETQFGKETDFCLAKFGNKTNFYGAQFGDQTNFDDSEFKDYTEFGKALFGSKTNFCNAQFGIITNFEKAVFGDAVDFENVQFCNQVNFMNAYFKGQTIFKDIKFRENNLNNINNFTKIVFEKPDQVLFENINLKLFALVKTNVQDINFFNCDWPKFEKRYAIFDENYFYEKEANNTDYLAKASLVEIEQLYLRLQKNFEDNKLYAEAGDFYIGAMEMRRKQLAGDKTKAWRWLRQNIFSLISWYRYFSFFGERYLRTAIWMLIILFLFPFLFLITGFEYPTTIEMSMHYEHIDYDLNQGLDFFKIIKNYSKAIAVSFYALTFQRNVPFRLSIVGQIISITESTISAILLTLFLLALKRRFRR